MQLSYVAKDRRTGRKVSSIAEAENIPALTRRLSQQGMLPLKISPLKDKEIPKFAHRSRLKGNVKGKELAIFTRQLGATLAAGLLLSDALITVSEDMENAFFGKVVQSVREHVVSGMNLSLAMAMYPQVFPNSYVSVIKSGEATGQLHLTLTNLAKFLENIESIKQKVRSAIQYPMFVFSFACLVVGGMVLFVVPRFKDIFEQAGAELPMMTRVVVSVSDFILTHFLFMSLCAVFLLIVFMAALRAKRTRYLIDKYRIHIPVLGKQVIHKMLVSRFCRTIGFLISSGVPIGTSLEITSQVVSDLVMEEATKKIKTRIMSGASLSEAVREHKIFPMLVTKMSLVGEKTGRISQMLTKTADYYDEELECTIQNLVVLIEPVMIIGVGILVAIVVVALYLPIFKVSLLVK